MAYISEIAITGLAGRRGTTRYNLDRHVNVFWGMNGSGKTSLLRVIHSALNNDAAGLRRVPFTQAELTIHSDVGDRVMTRSIDMTKQDDEDGQQYMVDDEGDLVMIGTTTRAWRSYVSSRQEDQDPSRPVAHAYLPISRVAESRTRRRLSSRSQSREAMDDAYFDEMFAEQVGLRWQAYNAEANAYIRDVQQQGLAEVLSLLLGGAAAAKRLQSRTLEDEKVAYALVAQFLNRQNIRLRINEKDFRERYRREPDLPLIVGRIREILFDIDRTLEPQRQLSNLIGDLYSGGKTVELSSRGISITLGDESIPLQSLSSGEKQLLQILLETLAAGPAPVIIDEPELSMHVDWQRTLVHNMTLLNPHGQLILATHSPEVMAELPDRFVHEV